MMIPSKRVANATLLLLSVVCFASATFPVYPRVMHAPPTPFKANGDVNLEPIPQFAKFAASVGVNTVWVCGGIGQFDTLTMDERKAVAVAWINTVKEQNLPLYIIVHVGTTVQRDAIMLAQHALSAGADAIASVPTYYERPGSAAAVVEWLAPIAAAAPSLPFWYYHIPGSTGVQINIMDFMQTGPQKIPNLAGFKYVDETPADYLQCVESYGGNYTFMWAPEPKLQALPLGATSAVLAESFYAQTWLRMFDHFKAGNMTAAREEQMWKYKAMAIFSAAGGGAAERTIWPKMAGFDLGPPRPPQSPISPAAQAELIKQLDAIDFWKLAGPPSSASHSDDSSSVSQRRHLTISRK